MRRFTTRIGVLAAAVMLACTVGGTARSSAVPSAAPRAAAAEEPTYFEMTDITGQPFVIKLTDSARIEEARRILRGEEPDRLHVLGRIIKRRESYNRRWSFVLDPDTVSFFEVAIEVCDATTPYVEDHLDEAGGPFLPGLYWCPWTSRLVRELPSP
ncbi:calmodulin-binding protein [Streptomyces sp. ICBB 8177]|uniref:BP74-related protein n=1 Tax=Streptomyces sp. ICBB 8177 TaxID=563922 RepID=UPI000D6762A8|nr:calmodulin-binding protein [Streptomyces sp. ICBB 8177]PWI45188.1 calmodulin-binding protein [Streptomyces sp. ICBB 8177]